MISRFSDLSAERFIVGTLIVPDGIEVLRQYNIATDLFSNPDARKAFASALRLDERGAPVHAESIGREAGLPEVWHLELCADDTFPINRHIIEDCVDRLRSCYTRRLTDELFKRHSEGCIEIDELTDKLLDLRGAAKVGNGPSFIDFEELLSEELQQEVPSVAEIWPGTCLFYRGRLNEAHSEPGLGKTNVLSSATIRVIQGGGTVIYIDPEDTPRGFVSRLLSLGADPEDIRSRVKYLHNPDPGDIAAAIQWAKSNPVELVVLDGCAEAMAAVGADENSAADVLAFFRANLRPFAEAGAAVVVADHVTKSTESRGRWARGSGAKLGRYDGAVYEIAPGKAYTPTQPGFVRLKISKDRCGGAGAFGQVVAEVHFAPGHKGTAVVFKSPAGDGEFRPTTIMARIVDRLAAGSASKREIRLCGKAEYVDQAIEILISEGQIVKSRDGQKDVFSLSKACPKSRDTLVGEEA